ncbi:hypothetical protein DFJ73DRAFT_764221 [Zopfochytrium polystomum]|nr:hypothetical protein DFJ73DRAFT_764221 [Zopfochytrium polystomum]
MKILVIGGGVTGPALALALKRAGHEVEVYDRARPLRYSPTQSAATNPANPTVPVHEPGDVGGGLTLMENGLRVLRHLGLLDEVVAAGAAVERIEMRKISSELIASFPVVNHDGLTTVNILRTSITRAISAALNREGIFIKTDKHLVGIEQPPEGSGALGVRAIFRDGTVAVGDILIGADGVHSGVRGILFPDVKPFKSGFVGYLGVSEYDEAFNWPSRALTFFTDSVAGKSAMIMRASEQRMHWALYETVQSEISHDDWEPYYDLEAESKRIAEMARAWNMGEAIMPMIHRSVRIVPLTIYDLETAPQWHKGNCVLVGDAVHAMVPFIGQGASVALEDVDVLTALLLRLSDRPRLAFELFQEARYARCKKIVENARLQGKRQYASSTVGSAIGNGFLKLFAFIARVRNANLNPDDMLTYDGYEAVRLLLLKKGIIGTSS